MVKDKCHPSDIWKEDKSLTGDKLFANFEEAYIVKNKLQKVCSSILYKVIKV